MAPALHFNSSRDQGEKKVYARLDEFMWKNFTDLYLQVMKTAKLAELMKHEL